MSTRDLWLTIRKIITPVELHSGSFDIAKREADYMLEAIKSSPRGKFLNSRTTRT